MMALLKIARIRTGTATEDSFVDLAGYAACGAEIASTSLSENEEDSKGYINYSKEETDVERIAHLLYQLYLTRNYEKEDI